jgi:hypothetical protein
MVESISIPIELLEQFEHGNVLLFVGEGIKRGALSSSAELAKELAARCDYPPEEPLTLPRVAGYYEMTRGRRGLIQFLRDRLDRPALGPLRAHELAVQLRPRVIVTSCYDRLLERALQEAGTPYIAVVGNAEIAYAEESKVLLVWLWGVFDQPDSIIVTEDDRRLFLEDRANLSDVLRAELARRTWLFVGFDAEDDWFRGFYDSVSRGLDRHRQRACIVGAAPGAYTRAWWEKRSAEILGAEVEPFLVALTDQLAARARPEIPALRPVITHAEPRPLPEEPYKALVSYEAKDRAMFFGRDREIEELTALIHAHRLVLLYGASGVGKTSLLHAGVILRLEEAEPGYTVFSVRALSDPVAAICAALRRQWPDLELPPSDTSLVDFLAAATCVSGRPLVLVIDQFEEFFIRLSPELRAEFIAELGALHDARTLPVKVVLSLREDYLASVSELENRIPEVFRTRMRLLFLTREEAHDAIICPVEALGYSYEPSLVEQLLDDLEREGVMPPQLQLVCNALFHRARADGRKTLTIADYEALDGAQGVLRGYLDEELRYLPAEEQALARDLLEELVTSERTKKVETLTELRTALDTDPAILDAVVEKLVRARLLRTLEREDGEIAYELAHEYLIREISLGAEAQARKAAEELLTQELNNWRRYGTSMSADHLHFIAPYVGKLALSDEAWGLLLRSALDYNYDVTFWIDRRPDPHRAASEVLSFLMETDLKKGEKGQVINVADELGWEGDEQADWYLPLLAGLTNCLTSTDKAVQTRAREVLACVGPPLSLSWGHRLLIYLAGLPFLVPEYISQILLFGFGSFLGGLLGGVILVPLGWFLVPGFMHLSESQALLQAVTRLMLILGPGLGIVGMLIGYGLGLGIVIGRGRSALIEATISGVGGALGGSLLVGYLYLLDVFGTDISPAVAVPGFATLCALATGIVVYSIRRMKRLLERGQTVGQIIAGAATGAVIGALGDIIFGSFPAILVTGMLFSAGIAVGLGWAERRSGIGRGDQAKVS